MTVVKLPKPFVEIPTFIPTGYRPPCRDVDPDLFFPVGDRYSDEGRKVCHSCDLKMACVKWAIDAGESYGLYGGLDPHERALLFAEVGSGESDHTGNWLSRRAAA